MPPFALMREHSMNIVSRRCSSVQAAHAALTAVCPLGKEGRFRIHPKSPTAQFAPIRPFVDHVLKETLIPALA